MRVELIDPYSDSRAYCELPTLTFKNIIINWLKQKDNYYIDTAKGKC